MEWQPIETMEKEQVEVLLWCAPHICIGQMVYRDWHGSCEDRLAYDGEDLVTLYPTHWKHLPKPPTDFKQEGNNE